MIDVLIVDDNPIVRTAIRTFLGTTDDIHVIGEAPDGHTALTSAQQLHPTVTLLDHRMPIADGLSIITTLAQHTRVLVLTSDPNPQLITGMLHGGAHGYLVHGQFNPPELLHAIHAIASGHGWLPPPIAAATITALRNQPTQKPNDSKPTHQLRQHHETLGLTRREQDVLDLLSTGYSNAAIGRRLLITEKTVKNHLNHIYTKLDVTNRTQAALRWTEH